MKITEKWTKVPAQLSVASIADKQIRENTAKLMENQRRNALNEDFGMNVGAPLGANQGIPYGGDGKAVFAPIAMALVRRVFPNLFANILVGVQPLNGPVGLAYALRFLYKDKNSDKIVEAGWKSVPKYSGYSGSTANTSGIPDAGTVVETETAEHWKVQGGTAEDFTKMPELGMMISRQAIVAKSRKLSASFSIESAEDIKRMQNVDMMTEMVKMLQYEMTAELDRETIGHCKNLCIKKVFNIVIHSIIIICLRNTSQFSRELTDKCILIHYSVPPFPLLHSLLLPVLLHLKEAYLCFPYIFPILPCRMPVDVFHNL